MDILNELTQTDLFAYILIGICAILLIILIAVVVSVIRGRKNKSEIALKPESGDEITSDSEDDENQDKYEEEIPDEEYEQEKEEPAFVSDEENTSQNTDEEETNVIERSQQAHTARHEKRDWQKESDTDKLDRHAYADGVNFKYAPNKERYDRYKDMDEQLNMSELNTKTFKIDEEPEQNPENNHSEEFEKDIKERLEKLETSISTVAESVQKMTEAIFNKNEETNTKIDDLSKDMLSLDRGAEIANLSDDVQKIIENQKESMNKPDVKVPSKEDIQGVVSESLKNVNENLESVKSQLGSNQEALIQNLNMIQESNIQEVLVQLLNDVKDVCGNTSNSLDSLMEKVNELNEGVKDLRQRKNEDGINEKLDALLAKEPVVPEIDLSPVKMMQSSFDRLSHKLESLERPKQSPVVSEHPVIQEDKKPKEKKENKQSGQNFEQEENAQEAKLNQTPDKKQDVKNVNTDSDKNEVKPATKKSDEVKSVVEPKQKKVMVQIKSNKKTDAQNEKTAQKQEQKHSEKKDGNKAAKNNSRRQKPTEKEIQKRQEEFHKNLIQKEEQREKEMDETLRKIPLQIQPVKAKAVPMSDEGIQEFKDMKKARKEAIKQKQEQSEHPIIQDVKEEMQEVFGLQDETEILNKSDVENAEHKTESEKQKDFSHESGQKFEKKLETSPEKHEVLSRVEDESEQVDVKEDAIPSYTEQRPRPYERNLSHGESFGNRASNSDRFVYREGVQEHAGDVETFRRARASRVQRNSAVSQRPQRAVRPSRRPFSY